jgi:hypothetical protein
MAMQRQTVSSFPRLPLWDASYATLQAARIQSRCDQSARWTHPLRSKPDGLRFQPVPPGEQQEREQHDQQTERNTGCVHKKRPFVASTASTEPVIQAAVGIADLIDVAQGCYQRHWQTAHSLKSLRWENFRWTGLGQLT